MTYLCLLVVFVVVVALPFAVVEDDDSRARLYLLICAAPAAIFVPTYVSAGVHGSGYGTLLLILVAFLLSFSLTLVGAVLLVRARHAAGTRGYIAAGMLLATLPMILVYLAESLGTG